MSTVTEKDLQELKDLMNKLVSDNIEIKITLAKLEGKIDTINARLDANKINFDKIPDLIEKVGELKNWRTIAVMVISAFITSLFWFLRTGKF